MDSSRRTLSRGPSQKQSRSSLEIGLRRLRCFELARLAGAHQVSLLNPLAVGLGVSIFIQISLKTQTRTALKSFESAVRDRPDVMECYVMTGDTDYLLRVVLPHIATVEKFIVDELSRFPGISRITSSFALRQVKYETALPLPPPEKKQQKKGRRGRSDNER